MHYEGGDQLQHGQVEQLQLVVVVWQPVDVSRRQNNCRQNSKTTDRPVKRACFGVVGQQQWQQVTRQVNRSHRIDATLSKRNE